MDARQQATDEADTRVPVVKCPTCPWAAGALSVLDTPMLARAHLHRALQTHLLKAHGVELPAEPAAERSTPVAALQAG